MPEIIVKPKDALSESRQAIYQAVELSRRAAATMWEAIENIWDQKGTAREKRFKRLQAWCSGNSPDIEIFRKYLGVSNGKYLPGGPFLSYKELKKVRRKVGWLKNKLLQETLRFKIRNGDATAYNLWFLTRIVICPAFFDQTKIEKASTIIHELMHDYPIVHGKSIFNLKDYKKCFCCEEAVQFAIDQPCKARRCAYNYEFLAQEIMLAHAME
ncbi:MAG: hypothetical protein JXB34_14565 [Bacteroidales bacterium]|nr:hypothetical protein [Bacteroidales bacterium]